MPPERAVGESRVASGFAARAVKAGHDAVADAGHVAVVRIVAGPERGREFRLSPGSSTVGRDPGCAVVLVDPYVSGTHARIDVAETIEVVDLDSANGLEADGETVTRWVAQPGHTVVIGDTELAIEPLNRSISVEAAVGGFQNAAVPFNRSPRVEARFPFRELARPQVPTESDTPPFPWLLMLAPIAMGGAMYAATRNPLSLMFVALSPMMMIANFVMSRQRSARKQESEIGRFEAHLSRLAEQLGGLRAAEQPARLAEAPSVLAVYEQVLVRGPLTWTRRPEHWSFLHLRLGLATLPSRTTVAEREGPVDGLIDHADRLETVVAEHATVVGVPVVESLEAAGALGLVGHGDHVGDLLRAVVVQLSGLHSPAELILAAVAPATRSDDLDWLKWLPHTSSPHSPLTRSHLADSAAAGDSLVAELDELIDHRLGQRGAAQQSRGAMAEDLAAGNSGGRVGSTGSERPVPVTPSVVVVVQEGTHVDRARLVRVAERGADVGVHLIWVADTVGELPAVCRSYVDVSGGPSAASVHHVRLGSSVFDVTVEGVSAAHALEFSRRMAAMVDAGALVEDATDLPRNVPVLSLLGEALASRPEAVLDRWDQNDSIVSRASGGARRQAVAKKDKKPTLRALVGKVGADSLHLDLRSHGPHALVAGTTGSGKSEFLQAWVLGMAAEYSPDRVTMLFVDYKGGAAFAECVDLPHCVGLVTDLSPHLVQRSLTSLAAEVHHREVLFNQKKAKDLIELERRGDPDCPPALVLVIDEFAALAAEVPAFVDGVVDIAQRGRSLGIHLVMATQRPAGVIRDNIRANTNLRIALRMADETDSQDVLGSPVAAHLDPDAPGRALAKTGPGRLVPFQSAYAGGWSDADASTSSIAIHELRFGTETPWRPAAVATEVELEAGPTDLQRLVGTISVAAREGALRVPRRPWLPELSKVYDLKLLNPRSDDRLVIGVADLPDQQRQDAVHFVPDVDGNLAVFGTSGSGKSVLLRTLAAAAGVTPRGGPVEVYGLDFGSGGLRMLEQLPHVGAVVNGDQTDRVSRLFRRLKAVADRRAGTFTAAEAGTIGDYRRAAGEPDEPRILLLIDNFPAFRNDYDGVIGRSHNYAAFQQLLSEGRKLGIHVILTADRPASVPGSVSSSVPRRVVLRMADESSYAALDVPRDVLSSSSPPGRGLLDDREVQVAVLGGAADVADQASALRRLGESIARTGRRPALPVGSLPTEVKLVDLPTQVDGRPLLGVSDEDLEPMGFDPQGVLLVTGGPGSGRSMALSGLVQSLRRCDPGIETWYVGGSRSALGAREDWTGTARTLEEVQELVPSLIEHLGRSGEPRSAVIVEGLSDFQVPKVAELLVELVRTVKRSDHLFIGEAENSQFGGFGASLLTEVRGSRRGLLLQPEPADGDLLRVQLPRASRNEFPPGRGYYVSGGKVVRVQLPLV
nr:FtsK/SpoIIIE domain-containing protein [Nocardioides flavescens]